MAKCSSFFGNLFSKHQTGFWKGLNPQRCLVAVIEKFRISLDEESEYAALHTDCLQLFTKQSNISKIACLRI